MKLMITSIITSDAGSDSTAALKENLFMCTLIVTGIKLIVKSVNIRQYVLDHVDAKRVVSHAEYSVENEQLTDHVSNVAQL